MAFLHALHTAPSVPVAARAHCKNREAFINGNQKISLPSLMKIASERKVPSSSKLSPQTKTLLSEIYIISKSPDLLF